jgi:hypothetical protein
VLSTTVGKIAAGTAGVTGTGSLGITVAALARMASAHTVPTGVWVGLAALTAATVSLAGLVLIFDYRLGRLEIAARADEVRSQAELEKIRLETYRVLVEKSAARPKNAASYRDLILADALHQAVENGLLPADQTHGQLYTPR